MKNKMIQDLHSHTYYSDCGIDAPESIIDAAIAGGITHFGICDHNYGIGDRLEEYFVRLTELKEKYKDRITLYRGVEIATCNDFKAPKAEDDFSMFDYCLLEHVDNENSVIGNLFEFAARLSCPVGIAHTDMFGYCADRELDPLVFFTSLADAGIFWEMNVNYDSIHRYNEHAYVKEFLNNTEQQNIVRRSGLALSVGFDGHCVEDYLPDRVIDMNVFLQELEIRQWRA